MTYVILSSSGNGHFGNLSNRLGDSKNRSRTDAPVGTIGYDP